MSKPMTKAAMAERIKQLEDLNLSLSKVLNMVDDGQWVVIRETDRKRYIAVIDALVSAGDGLDDYAARLDGTTNGMLDCRQRWHDVKASERL